MHWPWDRRRPQRSRPRAEACAALADLELPRYDLRVGGARYLTGDGVPHCLFDGSFEHSAGINGTDYALGFALALPPDWAGRFLYQGGGGPTGTVHSPTGESAMADTTARDRGFALTSSGGHKGSVWAGTFLEDQTAALNFAGWST